MASREQIAALCAEARQHGFASVCTNPLWTGFVREQLTGSDVLTCAVVGFPLGASATEVKAFEAATAVAAGADYVKTSTGFSTAGATVEDVRLMRSAVGPDVGVKASGGIRTREDALAMVEAGASRIGASNGPALLG